MGRKSSIKNKNAYLKARESIGLTREQAAECLQFISESRIEKIESEKTIAHPDEILAMASAYKSPSLCNYYCTNDCAIGSETINPISSKPLSQIVLEMLSTLNHLNAEKDRMMEIAADGLISEEEKKDFDKITNDLDKISSAIDSLKLWINEQRINS